MMIVFVFSAVIGMAVYHADMHGTQLIVAVAALVTPMFAFVSAAGVVAYIGIEFYPITVLVPYLVLAIGEQLQLFYF